MTRGALAKPHFAARQMPTLWLGDCTSRNHDLGRLVRPQLLRAGTGVATNHRAASRGRSSKEFASRLGIVIEEADEAQFWFDVLIEFKYGPQEVALRLRREAEELTAIFGASRRTVLKRINRRRAT